MQHRTGLGGVAEAGLPSFEMRAGTLARIVAKLNATFFDIFKDPVFRKKWEAIGTPVVAGTLDDFGRLMRTESVRLGRVIREAGVTPD